MRLLIYLAALLIVSVISALKVPPFPFNDSALFEYYGAAISHGAHLYRDLNDVKPPSVYFVDAALNWAFGAHYVLHTWLEAALNAAAAVLFALLARALGVTAWAPVSLLFAVAFCLSTPQFNQVQQYAVLLILGGYLLAWRGAPVAAGAALACATTFWIPAALLVLPLFGLRAVRFAGQRALLGCAGFAVAYYCVVAFALGPAWPREMISLWARNLGGHGFSLDPIVPTFTESTIGTSIVALACLIAAVVRKPLTEPQRFALLWAGCSLAAALVPPRFYDLYFLPSIPALAMTVGVYAGSWQALLRRPVFTLLALGLACLTTRNGIVETQTAYNYTSFARGVGEWIAGSVGGGRILWTDDYVPELYLAAGAVPTSASSMVLNDVVSESGVNRIVRLSRAPELVVLGGPDVARAPEPPELTMNGSTYVRVCPNLTLGKMSVFATPPLAGRFYCKN